MIAAVSGVQFYRQDSKVDSNTHGSSLPQIGDQPPQVDQDWRASQDIGFLVLGTTRMVGHPRFDAVLLSGLMAG